MNRKRCAVCKLPVSDDYFVHSFTDFNGKRHRVYLHANRGDDIEITCAIKHSFCIPAFSTSSLYSYSNRYESVFVIKSSKV